MKIAASASASVPDVRRGQVGVVSGSQLLGKYHICIKGQIGAFIVTCKDSWEMVLDEGFQARQAGADDTGIQLDYTMVLSQLARMQSKEAKRGVLYIPPYCVRHRVPGEVLALQQRTRNDCQPNNAHDAYAI